MNLNAIPGLWNFQRTIKVGVGIPNGCGQLTVRNLSFNHFAEALTGSHIEMVQEFADLLLLTYKFGGYWVYGRNQERKKYRSGKKTVKYKKSDIILAKLQTEVEMICLWVRGHTYDLHYHLNGISPKEYTYIASDVEVNEMLHRDCAHIEIVVSPMNEMNADTLTENGNGMAKSKTWSVDDPINDDFSDSNLNEENIDNQICIGTRFVDARNFKQFLCSYAIAQNFRVVINSSDKKRVIAICSSEGCPWRVRASVCTDGDTFEIKKVCSTHSCAGVNKIGNKSATVDWVATEIQDIVKKYPDIPPKQINSNLERTYGLSLPYMKLWRSREQAREAIFGSVDNNYKWVPTLAGELQLRNPGSHIVFETAREDNSFKRFFVSFRVCIDGFLGGCRPLLGLDACHLKSKYLGMLLSAVSLDGNNNLFVVAFAVVETESKEPWRWFLENLLHSFGYHVHPLAFMSDMEKGLAEATKHVFPYAEHRVCLRHLWKNLKKQFRVPDGHKLRNLFWSATKAYTEDTFISKMAELHDMNPKIFNYLMSLPYVWSKSQFSVQIKSTVSTNNMAESFNAWVAAARNIGIHECSCKEWQVSGLPCIHAVAFISEKGHSTWHSYVSDHYYTSRYKIAYEGGIAPMQGKEAWKAVPQSIHVELPNTSRPRGRPKKKRFKNFLEDVGTSRKSKHKCSRCGLLGHHKTSCKNPIGNIHLPEHGGPPRTNMSLDES